MATRLDSLPEALSVLGVKLHPVTMEEALDRLEGFLREGGFHLVVTLGTEMVMRAQEDPDFRDLVNGADLVVPDGGGLVWAARRCGFRVPEKVAGVEMVDRLAGRLAAGGPSLFLLGAGPGVAEEAGAVLQRRHPGLRVAGARDGFFREDAPVVQAVQASGAGLLLVGLGSPRQERWMRDHQDALGVAVGIGVGGSFDVIAGRKERAPRWMIRLGLEWLHRLLKEPSRLGRMLAIPRFMARVLRDRGRAVRPWTAEGGP